MKKSIIIVLALSIITLNSCDDFLNIKPKDTKVVKTVKDYRDIMSSYMDWLNAINSRVDYVLGSRNMYPPLDQAQICGFYTGELEFKEETIMNTDTDEMKPYIREWLSWSVVSSYSWNSYYKCTGSLNYVIDNINDAVLSEENNKEDEKYISMRNYVKGEALVWRAFFYYKLLQLYCPYKLNEYGLVDNRNLYLDPIHADLKRSTLKETYNIILSDCKAALKLLETTPPEEWNTAYNSDFINAMMASIYHFKAMSGASENSDWSNAITHADKAIGERAMVNDSATMAEMFNMNITSGFIKFDSDEHFLRIIKKHAFRFHDSGYAGSTFSLKTANPAHYDMYDNSDVRKITYFKDLGTNVVYNKYNMHQGKPSSGGGVFIPFRLADMMLIKAEALIRTDKESESRTILEKFKQGRYSVTQTIPSGKENLLNEILRERRLEFFHENDMRWLEMKRLNLEYDRGIIGRIRFTLKPDDFRYTFPIPLSELKEVNSLVQNPGWNLIVVE